MTAAPEFEDFIGRWREVINSQRTADEITVTDATNLHAMAEFAERHHAWPVAPSRTVDLWGFGEGLVLFEPADGGWWVTLASLVEPTGLSFTRLKELFHKSRVEFDGHDADVVDLADGPIELVQHGFVMRLFATYSPWAGEFQANTMALMAHALEHSGLADRFAKSSPTGFVAIAEMELSNGEKTETFKVQMTVRAFDPVDNVPIVAAPWDDADPNERVRITDLCTGYTVVRASDAVHAFLGPRVSEDEAIRLAYRGPHLDDT